MTDILAIIQNGNGNIKLEVTGEDLLKALVPISGDIAPMVYVNDTLYRIVDPQPNFADEKSSFNLLGKIESTVSSSEEPKEISKQMMIL